MRRLVSALAAAVLALGVLVAPAGARPVSPSWAYDCWAYSYSPWYSNYMVYGKGRGYCRAPYNAEIYRIKLTVKIQQQEYGQYRTKKTAGWTYRYVDSGQYVGWKTTWYQCYAPYRYAWFRVVVIIAAYNSYGTLMGKATKIGSSKWLSC